MMKELLQKFCDPKNPKLLEPWSDGKWSVASDGHLAIRVPRLADIVRPRPFEDIASWEPTAAGEWVGRPAYDLPAMINCHRCKTTGRISSCRECLGEGVLEFANDFNNYFVDCDSCGGEGAVSGGDTICDNCDGTGHHYEQRVVEILFHGHAINALLLEKIKNLPELRIFTAPTDKALFHFIFTGGMGVFMGLRDHEDDQSS